MTRAELEKEAEEKYSEVDREFVDCQDEGEIFNLGYLAGAEPREKQITELSNTIKNLKKAYRKQRNKRIDNLQKKNAELKIRLEALEGQTPWKDIKDKSELIKENAELKARIGLSIECDKAQKNGELCLGYGGDEPCEQCKNCIKCECGYYQLGETEKDEQLTKAKDLLKRCYDTYVYEACIRREIEQFLNSEVKQ